MSDPFAALPSELAQSLKNRGFTTLTTVQEAVVQSESLGADLRISSQTGSGKTVAVGIAIARALLAEGARTGKPFGRGPSAVLLTPTRELAAQVQRELDWLLAHVPDGSVDVVTGGTSVGLERKRLAQGPRVLVGTPGRLLDHLSEGAFDGSTVKTVILDEADQMLDMGFRDELAGILERLPNRERTHLVSATFSGEVERMARQFQSQPLKLEGSPLGKANEDIEHVAHVVEMRHRYDALVNVLLYRAAQREETEGRTLVFTRTRADTIEVAEKLQRDGIRAEPMSGDLAQAQRTRTLKAFRTGQITTIVATDVAARGLDVQGVELVIHLDPPMDSDTFTHRSGRTGRAGQKGTSVLILPPQARRRIERLCADARVKPNFEPVPTPQKIQKAYQKLDRRRIYKVLQEYELTVQNTALPDEATAELALTPTSRQASALASDLEFSKKLLEGKSPELVVGALLSLVTQGPPCPPREVSVPLEHHGHPKDRSKGHRPFGRAAHPRAEGQSWGGASSYERPRSAGGPPPGWRGDFRPDDRPSSAHSGGPSHSAPFPPRTRPFEGDRRPTGDRFRTGGPPGKHKKFRPPR